MSTPDAIGFFKEELLAFTVMMTLRIAEDLSDDPSPMLTVILKAAELDSALNTLHEALMKRDANLAKANGVRG